MAKKKVKLPKRVAGVKIPKDVRKRGEALIARATSPEGQAAIAKGLTLAAGLATMAAERSARRATDPAESAEGGRPSPTPSSAPIDPAKIGEAVEMIATTVFGRVFGTRT